MADLNLAFACGHTYRLDRSGGSVDLCIPFRRARDLLFVCKAIEESKGRGTALKGNFISWNEKGEI
jgi:hypothetical protein